MSGSRHAHTHCDGNLSKNHLDKSDIVPAVGARAREQTTTGLVIPVDGQEWGGNNLLFADISRLVQ